MTARVIVAEILNMDSGVRTFAVKPTSPNGLLFYVKVSIYDRDIKYSLIREIESKMGLIPEQSLDLQLMDSESLKMFCDKNDYRVRANPIEEVEHGNGD
jgi:hypothetical protein